MSIKCWNNKGLSLVEVIMAALLVALMVAGLFAVNINASNMSMLAKHKAIALTWAQSEQEKTRSQYTFVAASDPGIPNQLSGDGPANPGKNGTVVTAQTVYGTRMFRQTATVAWTE